MAEREGLVFVCETLQLGFSSVQKLLKRIAGTAT